MKLAFFEIMKKKPRPYQKVAIKKAIAHYKDSDRGKLIMACGTGKTLTSFWIADKLNAQSVVVVMPSINLERQTLKAWVEESKYAKNKYSYLCICSDGTATDDIEVDEGIIIPVTTSLDEAKFWLRMYRNKPIVIFTTYQSAEIVAKAVKSIGTTFDFGILDEAHRTVGNIDKPFSRFLFNKNVKISKRLFTTATEKVFSGAKDDIISMDDKRLYGDEIYSLSTKKAIEDGDLCDYGIVTMYSKIEKIRDFVRENPYIIDPKHGIDEKQRMLLIACALTTLKTAKKKRLSHIISYHNTIKKAKVFKELMEKMGELLGIKINTFHINGKMNSSEREEIISEYKKSNMAIITNARALQEGIDITEVDGIVFAEKRSSTIDIVHSVGRSLRTHEGKKKSFVLVPCFISKEGAFDEYSDLEFDFGNILMVINAMATSDERIVDYFRELNDGKKGEGGEGIIEDEVGKVDISLIDLQKMSQHIQHKAWEKTARLFWIPYIELGKAVRKEGIISTTVYK